MHNEVEQLVATSIDNPSLSLSSPCVKWEIIIVAI